MELRPEADGHQVRGRGYGILGANFFALAGTSLVGAKGGSMMGLDFIVGPPPRVVVGTQPVFGALGTVDTTSGINVPFTANYSQITPGSTFQISGSVWGIVSGQAN
jgi:hypothetical protein